jgi:hypothetical protein
MQQSSWELAETVALDLVSRGTDVNEVQKVATGLRVFAERHPEQAGERMFTFIETMLRDGHHFVRSNQTLGYYRKLQEVSRLHLSAFRKSTPEAGRELAEILGWTVRLMRYYKTDDAREEMLRKQRQRENQPQLAGTSSGTSTGRSQAHSAEPRFEPPAKLRLIKPKVVIKTETIRELVTLAVSAKAGKARVRTRQGEEITCTGIPPYPPANEGDTCNADVVREKGRAVKATFKAWR